MVIEICDVIREGGSASDATLLKHLPKNLSDGVAVPLLVLGAWRANDGERDNEKDRGSLKAESGWRAWAVAQQRPAIECVKMTCWRCLPDMATAVWMLMPCSSRQSKARSLKVGLNGIPLFIHVYMLSGRLLSGFWWLCWMRYLFWNLDRDEQQEKVKKTVTKRVGNLHSMAEKDFRQQPQENYESLAAIWS